MPCIKIAVQGSKRIEAVLRDGFNAEGRGLHEYLTDVEHRIPANIVRQARYIASVRNKVVHEEEEIHDLDKFNQTVEQVIHAMNNILEKERLKKETLQRGRYHGEALEKKPSGRINALFIFFAIIGAIYFWLLLQEERDKRRQESIKNAQQINLLQRQLNAIQAEQKKNTLPPAPAAAKPAEAAPKPPASARQTEKKPVSSAAQNLKSKKDLSVNSKSKASDRPLAKSGAAVRSAQTPSPKQGSLLAKAKSSSSAYDQALQEISGGLVSMLRKDTQITLGNADVAQDADGTFSVRVPVSWSISGQKVLALLNHHFNSYSGRPLSLSSEHMRNDKNRIIVNKRNAESSSAIKPYSGRLFKELQKIEISIEVSLGNKKTRLVIAGNARCHVSCSYTNRRADSWIVQVNGKPGDSTLSRDQETPVVIKGLTEADLQNSGLPVAIIR